MLWSSLLSCACADLFLPLPVFIPLCYSVRERRFLFMRWRTWDVLDVSFSHRLHRRTEFTEVPHRPLKDTDITEPNGVQVAWISLIIFLMLWSSLLSCACAGLFCTLSVFMPLRYSVRERLFLFMSRRTWDALDVSVSHRAHRRTEFTEVAHRALKDTDVTEPNGV